ncbi:MAG: pantoate--beta-alanine ligase [Microscillaceae bacterium]
MQMISQSSEWASVPLLPHQHRGFVPTMGALHEGHLALIRKAQEQNDQVVCSIYVNPAQFNNPEDLARYPRVLAQDLEQLAEFPNLIVFTPRDEEMYPAPPRVRFDFGKLEQVMEGQYRPGHFNGVALVVAKLFHLVQPHRAYFGRKDLQQTLIVKQLIDDLAFPVELVVCPTVREEDGLALSSRNRRLSTEQRQQAVLIPQTLFEVRRRILAGGHPLPELYQFVSEQFAQSELRLEYFQIVHRQTLEPVAHLEAPAALALCLAAYAGEIRLIDNVVLTLKKEV